MKLLQEISESIKLLKEDSVVDGTGGNYFIEGIFIMADIQNRNGRVYPSEVIEPEIQKYTTNFILKKRAFGELGHPNNPSLNLDRSSHLITELHRDGSNWYGRAKILDTDMGRIVKVFMDEGCTLGVSSRGLGSIKDVKGVKTVQEDFMLITAGDIVSDPSAPEAFVTNIMEEPEWVMEKGEWVPRFLEDSKKAIAYSYRMNMLKEEKEKLFLEQFNKFLKNL
jgi:hypothetical protein